VGTRSLAAVLKPLAERFGYNNRGLLYWKNGEELTKLIHLQASRWHRGGVYVNIGVTPNVLITKRVPPGTGYWALELRPTQWEWASFRVFEALERGTVDHDSARVESALRWLVRWIEQSLNEATLRAALRDRHHWLAAYATAILKDWALGKLKNDPSDYFGEVTPYYGSKARGRSFR
jgi:hypothetical protein